ncbi:MAG TPA: hypothetical protein VEJ47_09395 [Candidatus Eremiobacteraceae bacterium]|nr:hypothetical protein [Candidatus Eremiobacteraceae bacterium]
MKVAVTLILALALVCIAAPSTYADPVRQVLQGTEIHLTLLTPVSTSISREGDPFVAVLAQPVVFDSRILLPAGTRVNGVVGVMQKPKAFSVFRGQAYMTLTFKTIELDSRLIPVHMSILAIGQPRVDSYSKPRKDMKVTEGEVLQEKHDFKGDAVGVAVGGGAGTLVGAIFSNLGRGIGLGFVGGAAYVVARKGKEVDLPMNSGILARMDNSVNLPAIAAENGSGAAESSGSQ